MPKAEHRKIAKSAKKAGLKAGSDRYNAYVFNTLYKIHERRKRKRKKK